MVDIKEKCDGIYIKFKDNGRGINESAILKKALDKRIPTEEKAENMDSKGIKNLNFMPSFSTKEDATETSGRGVGIDVVKKNIEKF